jgi:hypothetical protein
MALLPAAIVALLQGYPVLNVEGGTIVTSPVGLAEIFDSVTVEAMGVGCC